MDAYSLGQLLRQARDDRELTLEDAKTKTRIAVPILESFEGGMFQIADLSQVQLRGMLANYATYLGLDPDTILTYYTDSQALANRRRRGRQPSASAANSRRSSTEARRTT